MSRRWTMIERMEEDRERDILTTVCVGFVFNDESVFDFSYKVHFLKRSSKLKLFLRDG
jgi:hypothetical protein